MSRRVKEFADIGDHMSLDELIEKLTQLRDSLPEDAEAELKLRGDDVFGRRITIAYFRKQTANEAELEKRYDDADTEAKAEEFERRQREIGVASYAAPGKRGKLRSAS